MQKGYVIGGLAVLGAIALISWYKKPKKNSEGFFGATGRGRLTSRVASQNCAYCRTSGGDVYHTGSDRNCSGSDTCITRYAYVQ
jgi:hypothetical protein